jgi:hypothetical protein
VGDEQYQIAEDADGEPIELSDGTETLTPLGAYVTGDESETEDTLDDLLQEGLDHEDEPEHQPKLLARTKTTAALPQGSVEWNPTTGRLEIINAAPGTESAATATKIASRPKKSQKDGSVRMLSTTKALK